MPEVYVSFPDSDLGTANELAADLRQRLAEEAPEVEVRQVREDADNQDLGAALALVLGAPSVVIVARGVAAWIGSKRTRVKFSAFDVDGKKYDLNYDGREPGAGEALKAVLRAGQRQDQ